MHKRLLLIYCLHITHKYLGILPPTYLLTYTAHSLHTTTPNFFKGSYRAAFWLAMPTDLCTTFQVVLHPKSATKIETLSRLPQ